MIATQETTRSQKDKILRHMQEHGSISPMDALQLYGCFRLGARIWDLKHEGHLIEPSISSIGGKRFAEYRLVKCDKNGQLSLL